MVFANKKCSVHSTRGALSFCQHCKDFFCGECLTEAGDYYYCSKALCAAVGAEAVIAKRKATSAALAYGFCATCLAETEEERSGGTFTLNGIGTRFFGQMEHCPVCKSVRTNAWICIFYIPIFRLARYRVIWLGRNRFLSRRLRKNPVHQCQ